MPVRARLRAALAHPRLVWCMALCGAALVLPSVGSERVLDDYVLALGSRGDPTLDGLPAHGLRLFDFATGERARNLALMEQGALLPWWADPELKLMFFRPLSSLSHRLDYALWPYSARLMYLHGLAWFVLCLILVGRLYRRIEQNASFAGLATVLFALDDAHGPVVAWLSNRNALIATAFGVLSLLAHVRARREQHAPSRFLSPVCLLFSLLAGEFGLGAVAYLVGYALSLEQGSFLRRLRSLALHAVALVVWGLFYHWSGAGTRGSGVYSHPLQNAGEFLGHLPGRLISLLAAAFGSFPADLVSLDSPERVWFWTTLGGIVLGLIGWALSATLRRDAGARFWLSSMLLAAVPVAASFPSDRLLFLVGIGGMALVARLISPLLDARVWRTAPRRTRAASWALAGVHCMLSPLELPLRAAQMQVLGRTLSAGSSYLDAVPNLSERTVVIVSTPADLFASYIQLQRAWDRVPRSQHLYWLANAAAPLSVRRVDENTLSIEREGGFGSTFLERHYRDAQAPLRRGATIVLSEMSAEVSSLTADGRPSRVDFHFARALESPEYLWLAWKGDRFEPLSIGPAGDVQQIPAENLGDILAHTAFGAHR
jgi:hypothetical protein